MEKETESTPSTPAKEVALSRKPARFSVFRLLSDFWVTISTVYALVAVFSLTDADKLRIRNAIAQSVSLAPAVEVAAKGTAVVIHVRLCRQEVCNGLDDDCDGDVDEGVLNALGACGAVPAEICNGLDDDGNGLVDDGIPDRECKLGTR